MDNRWINLLAGLTAFLIDRLDDASFQKSPSKTVHFLILLLFILRINRPFSSSVDSSIFRHKRKLPCQYYFARNWSRVMSLCVWILYAQSNLRFNIWNRSIFDSRVIFFFKLWSLKERRCNEIYCNSQWNIYIAMYSTTTINH